MDFASPCEALVTKPGFTQQREMLIDGKDTRVTLSLAPASDRVVVTATGAPIAIEEAGLAADVFTGRDFADSTVHHSCKTCCARCRA